MKTTLDVPIAPMLAKTTVTLTLRMRGVRWAMFRLWLAGHLISLAGYVGGFRSASVEIE